MQRTRETGWLLVGLIVILSAVFLAMAGVALALAQSRQLLSVRENDTEAVYLAQAGVMQALFDFRDPGNGGNGFALGQYIVDDGPGTQDDIFILGGKAADFLLANMISSVVDQGNLAGQPRDRLRDWRMRNVLITAAPVVRITHMSVAWENPTVPFGVGVIRIELNNTKVWPVVGQISTPQPSGTLLNIIDHTIPANTVRVRNTIWFSTTNIMSAKAFIDVTFRMSDHVASGNPLDASIRTAHYTQQTSTRSADFTIKSVGQVQKGAFPFVTWRRIQAEYRICGSATVPTNCDTSPEELTNTGKLLTYRELTQKSP